MSSVPVSRHCKYCDTLLVRREHRSSQHVRDSPFVKTAYAFLCPTCDAPGHVPAYAARYYEDGDA